MTRTQELLAFHRHRWHMAQALAPAPKTEAVAQGAGLKETAGARNGTPDGETCRKRG